MVMPPYPSYIVVPLKESLPAAGVEYRDMLFMVRGSPDKLYLVRYTGSAYENVDLSLIGDADLIALAALSTTGVAVRTGAGTWTTRTITGTANEVEVTNGDGVSGNPTLGLPDDVTIGDDLTLGSDGAILTLGATNVVTLTHSANTLTLGTGDTFTADDITTVDDVTVGDDLTLNSDGAILTMGSTNPITLTHSANTLTLGTGDTFTADDITTVDDVTVGDDLTLNSDGAILTMGSASPITLTHSANTLTLGTGDTFVADDITTVDDVIVGDDLTLNSDGAILTMGATNPVVITHSANTLTLAAGDSLSIGEDLTVGDDITMNSNGAILTMGSTNVITLTQGANTLTLGTGDTFTADDITTVDDLTVGDDLTLNSDGAILTMGNTNPVVITHSANTITLASGDSIATTGVTAGANLTSTGAVTITRDGTQSLLIEQAGGTNVVVTDTTNKLVKLPNSTGLRIYSDDESTEKFTVAGASGNTVVAGTLDVTGTTTLGTANITTATVSTTLNTQGATNLGNGTSDLLTHTGRYLTDGTSPTVAHGAAAGTGGSVGSTIEGTDMCGRITVTTGSSGTGAGTLATITFNATHSGDYAPILYMADADAAAQAGSFRTSSASTGTTTWVIATAATLATGTVFEFWYLLVEYTP